MPLPNRLWYIWQGNFQLKLTVGFSIVLLLVMLLGSAALLVQQDSTLQQTAENRARAMSHALAATGAAAVFDSLYRLQESLQQYRDDDELLDIDIIDEDGLIVASKRGERIGSTIESSEWKNGTKATTSITYRALLDGTPSLVILEPFRDPDGPIAGWVRIELSLKHIQAERTRTLWWMIAISTVLMGIGIVGSRIMVGYISTVFASIVTSLESAITSVQSGLLAAGRFPQERTVQSGLLQPGRHDFERLAGLAQNAGEYLITQSAALRDLTLSLEEKVTERTAELDRAKDQAIRSLEALRLSEASLRKAQAIAHLGSWEFALPSQNGGRCSDEVFRILGLNPGDEPPFAPGLLIHRTHQLDRALVEGALDEALTQHKPWDIEHRIVRPDETVRWVQSIGKPVLSDEGTPIKVVGTLLDITARKLAEEANAASQERLRRSREEREHLYQTLHDDTLQSLYAVALGLETALLLLPANSDQSSQHLQHSIAQLRRAAQEIRDTIPRLWPKAASADSLDATLSSMIELGGVWPRPLFTIDVDREVAARLTMEQELHLVTLSREAIENILRHAKAHTGTVRLRAWKERIRLEIQDDGMGFNPAAVSGGTEGFGIMEARAKKLNAELGISSSAGNGTIITLDIPPGIAPDTE